MDKKTTTFQAISLRVALCVLAVSAWAIDVSAQCNFSCSDHVYIPLDTICQAELSITDVIKNPTGCDNAVVMVFDDYGNNLGNVLEHRHRGTKLVYKVIDTVSSNSCWGYVTVEDKMAPLIECRNDTVNCWEAVGLLDPILKDNCWDLGYFEQSKLIWVDFDCDDEMFAGYYERDVITQDLWGNTSRCVGQRLYIIRESLDSLVCPEETVMIECCQQERINGVNMDVLWVSSYAYEDEDGYAHPIPGEGKLVEPPYLKDRGGKHYLTPDGNNKGKCNIITTYKDHIVPTCGASYKIRREWKLFDWCTGTDTICVQWIKIVDTTAPEIESNGLKEVCLDDPSHLWKNLDGNFECNIVTAYNITEYEDGCHQPKSYYVKPHDCLAHVTLSGPNVIGECGLKFAKGDPDKEAEYLSKIKVTYQLQYFDAGHPGKVITLTGDIPHGEDVHIYLPAGWYQVLYFIKDECWNETYACERILVEDNVAPTPVCDEITQVTLDPESCWVRVFAASLDDGSNDNCSQNLHYAVANMDSVDHYRNYWHGKLQDCLDPHFYEYEYKYIDQLIEKWINCFVFQDYVDLSECGREMLVMRVYEADGLPFLDPHLFKGTEHEWFCFNLYDDYACFYKYHYDEFANHLDPRIDLCDYKFELVEPSPCSDNDLNFYHPIVENGYCQCRAANVAQVNDPSCAPCEPLAIEKISFVDSEPSKSHGPEINRACCAYESESATVAQAEKWANLITKYPELYRMDCKRHKFQHLYNDCMIEVIKDDKTPPVCTAPDNVTAYCDGVPYIGSLLYGNDVIKWQGAQLAHDLCDSSDYFSASCFLDNSGDAAQEVMAPQEWCVANPWDGGTHGYYGGPSSNKYYGVFCGENYSWYEENVWWSPIYCRVWLLLDEFDDNASGKPNVNDYFGEPTIEENCWTYTDTSYIDGALNECGVGILTKTWIISDKCDNTSSCYQTVTIKPRSDFEVKFPEDLVINCDEGDIRLEPIKGSDLYPIITDDECELIGVSYKDQVLGEGDGCYKILRTWKVIDWCVYVPDIHNRYPDVIVNDTCVASDDRPCIIRNLKDDGDGYIAYLQVIKIVDTTAPVVTCEPIDTICSYDDDCESVDIDILIGTATDNCTPDDQITYRYTIIPDYARDETDYIFGHGNEVKRVLPVGLHKIILYATDDCNNRDSCSTYIYLKDCKPPTPYCYDGIATVLMANSGSVEIWASDFDAGSIDNCANHDSVLITFDAAGEVPSRTFNCTDIPDGQSTEIEVEVYVHDEFGNYDFCIVTLFLQDGSGNACPDLAPSALGETTTMDKQIMGNQVKSNKKVSNFGKSGLNQSKSDQNRAVLYQNRPNPYQHETLIGFEIDQSAKVQLRIMDVTGRVVHVDAGNFSNGYHEWKVNKHQLNIQSGVLYYQIETNDIVLTKKMVIIE